MHISTERRRAERGAAVAGRRPRLLHARDRPRAARRRRWTSAVHSLKDLPTQLEAGLTLAAVLARADARDALVSRAGAPLRDAAARVRASAPAACGAARFSRAPRPDAELLELRGNVPTRIERLQRGDYDAIVLAAAGLDAAGPRAAHQRVSAAGGFAAGGLAGSDRRVRARRRCARRCAGSRPSMTPRRALAATRRARAARGI